MDQSHRSGSSMVDDDEMTNPNEEMGSFVDETQSDRSYSCSRSNCDERNVTRPSYAESTDER
jgi:hypothetical protein